MSVTSALVVMSLVLASAAAAMAIWALREFGMTAKSARQFLVETQVRLIPLLEKADITVDAANAELLRIDAVISTFEDASVRVGAATGTLSDIVQAPAGVVGEVADRMRRAWKHRSHRHEEPPGTGEAVVGDPHESSTEDGS